MCIKTVSCFNEILTCSLCENAIWEVLIVQLIARVERKLGHFNIFAVIFQHFACSMSSIMPAHSELHVHTTNFVELRVFVCCGLNMCVCLRNVDSLRASICILWTQYVRQFVCGGLRTSVSIVDCVRLFACWTACVYDGIHAWVVRQSATVHCGNVVVSEYCEQILG